MSVELIIEVLDHAPRDLELEELIVLMVYAEQARSATRMASPKLLLVARRARCSERTASTVINKLVERNLLEHVARGQKYRHAATYRLAPMPGYGDRDAHRCKRCGEPVTRHGRRGPWPKRCARCKTSAGNPELRAEKSSARNPELRAEPDSAGNPELRASRHSQERSLSANLERIVTGAVDATPEEAREIVTMIMKKQQPKNPIAYFRTVAGKGDLASWLQELRDSQLDPANTGQDAPEADDRTSLWKRPMCEHDQPSGPNPGRPWEPYCPDCRRARRPA